MKYFWNFSAFLYGQCSQTQIIFGAYILSKKVQGPSFKCPFFTYTLKTEDKLNKDTYKIHLSKIF